MATFPFMMRREIDEAAPELKAGWNVRIGGKYFRIKKKRPWRVAHTYNINANAILRVDYVNVESQNLNPGTGLVNRRGYSGTFVGELKYLRQTKLVAFGTIANVAILYRREAYPYQAIVVFNSVTVPVSSPMVLQRFSYDTSMFFEFQMSRALLLATTQTIFLDMVEYEVYVVNLNAGEIYRVIYADGFMSEPKKV